jgi:hypothetical protein
LPLSDPGPPSPEGDGPDQKGWSWSERLPTTNIARRPPERSFGTSGMFAFLADQLQAGLCGVAFGDATMDTAGFTRIWRRLNRGCSGEARGLQRNSPMTIHQERRAIERTGFQRGALIVVPGLRGVYACGVRDFSREGAGLRLNGMALLPIDFKLSFDGIRHTFGCHLIWRDGDFAGVAFQQSPFRGIRS